MKSSEYWRKRFEELEEETHNKAKKTYEEIAPAFDSAMRKVDAEIERWYKRLADNNDISLADAKRLLNKDELEEFRWDVQEYIKAGKAVETNPEYIKMLENASARVHISRLEEIKIRTAEYIRTAYEAENEILTGNLEESYADSYYKSAYTIQKGTGIGVKVGQIDERKLDKILSTPWTSDGTTFSEKIWKEQTKLTSFAHTEITKMCILGGKPDDAINAIAKRV